MPSTRLAAAPSPIPKLAPELADFQAIAKRASLLGPSLVLEGVDMDSAGLDSAFIDALNWGALGESVSFCLSGVTYTVFENPEDDYRSSMACLISRQGNHCKNKFPGVPVIAEFKDTHDHKAFDMPISESAQDAYDPDLMTLSVVFRSGAGPDARQEALSVGTNHSDDYYPCFISYFSAEGLSRALSFHERQSLESELEPAPLAASSSQRV